MQFLMEQKATLNIYEHNVRVATREVIFLIYFFFFFIRILIVVMRNQ